MNGCGPVDIAIARLGINYVDHHVNLSMLHSLDRNGSMLPIIACLWKFVSALEIDRYSGFEIQFASRL